MAQPSRYDPSHEFLTDEGSDPSFPGSELDIEFAALQDTLDEILDNLALIQRDDGRLANGSVGFDQLDEDLQSAGLAALSAWATDTDYVESRIVVYGTALYKCLESHTSGTFATDLAAEKWELLVELPTGPTGPQGPGSGDVLRPSGGSDDMALARFDGILGDQLLNSPVLLSDDGELYPSSNGAGSLGTATNRWPIVQLSDGAQISFNNDILLTHSANHLAFTGGTYSFDGAVRPAANDGGALGSATVSWSDLFVASGGVLNFANGNYTVTHTSGNLAFSGTASFGGTLSPAADDGGALGTAAARFSDLFLATGAVINIGAGNDVTITHAANLVTFAGASSGWLFNETIAPATDDGAALGTTARHFSDLFLATGGVLNFNNGNYTLTHSSGALAASGSFSATAITASGALSGATAAGAMLASAAEMEAGTATNKLAQPGVMHRHPGVLKAAINFDGTGTPTARRAYNFGAITDNATGNYTIANSNTFSGSDYAVVGTASSPGVGQGIVHLVSLGTTSLNVRTHDFGGTNTDYVQVHLMVAGDL